MKSRSGFTVLDGHMSRRLGMALELLKKLNEQNLGNSTVAGQAFLNVVRYLSAGILLTCLSACGGDRQRDELNLRARFHVPSSVKLSSFESGPYEYGFTGREGLSIVGVFEFTEQQFRDYLKQTEDRAIWRPVPFRGRAPETETV